MRAPGGFTQIELAICLGVAALLAAVAVPRMAAWSDIARTHGAAYGLASALRQTRSRALESGETLTVRFDPAASSWEVRSADARVLGVVRLPPPLRFASLPLTGQIHFGGTGRADNATITLASGDSRARVVVNQRGRVRLG